MLLGHPAEAQFSECGTFAVMSFYPFWTPYIIHELHADPVTTRYYMTDYGHSRYYVTPSGEYAIDPDEVDQNSYRLISRKLHKGYLYEEDFNISSQLQDAERVHLDNVVIYPSSLSDSDRFLLLGENDDEKMRLLIAPCEGHALEIRPLSLSFNEAKRRLGAEWEKRRALQDQEVRGVETPNTVIEEN